LTTRGGEEAALARQALGEGYDTVVGVGGDGTWSSIADALLVYGKDGVTLGLLPAGTGNDFGRNLGISGEDPEGAVRALAGGRVIRSDMGRVVGECRHEGREEGPRSGRHFLNLVGFGFDVAAVDQAKKARLLRGALLYKVAAIQQLFRFSGFTVSVAEGGGEGREGAALMLTITNGPFFGGGFPISPGADVQDGLLHACLIGNAGPLRRVRLFQQAGRGRHVEMREVRSLTSTSFSLAFPSPPRFEMDGDVYAASDNALQVEVLPGALPILAP
jgi:diacylglycerol kinase (ATP)